MDIHYIYLTLNNINGKRYIGQRKLHGDIHKDKYLGSGTLILSAIKKHGKENFSKIILALCVNQEQADELEEYYFDKYKVLENKDLYYNRGFPGQYWRHGNHSKFMSKTMKDYYNKPENYAKILKIPAEHIKTYKLCESIEKAYHIERRKYKHLQSQIRIGKKKIIKHEVEQLRNIGIAIRGERHRRKSKYNSEKHRKLHHKFRGNPWTKSNIGQYKIAAIDRSESKEWRLNNSLTKYKHKEHPINNYIINNGIIKRSLPKSINDKIDKIITNKYSKLITINNAIKDINNYFGCIVA